MGGNGLGACHFRVKSDRHFKGKSDRHPEGESDRHPRETQKTGDRYRYR